MSPAPVIALTPSAQEPPEIAAPAFVGPDHLVDPFMAEGDPPRGVQPEADLLGTPTFRPHLTRDGATDTAGQVARLVPDLLLSGLRRVLGLLKAVTPPACVPSQFPADRPLAEPQGLADLSLGLARLSQGVELTAIFVGDPTIWSHS